MTKRLSFSITEIEDMMPFERDLFFDMFVEELEEENKRRQQE